MDPEFGILAVVLAQLQRDVGGNKDGADGGEGEATDSESEAEEPAEYACPGSLRTTGSRMRRRRPGAPPANQACLGGIGAGNLPPA